jgi:hypothetical protein
MMGSQNPHLPTALRPAASPVKSTGEVFGGRAAAGVERARRSNRRLHLRMRDHSDWKSSELDSETHEERRQD